MAAYVKFDGIDGEVEDKDHKAWVEVESFSQGFHKPGGGTGSQRRGGDVQVSDISVTKSGDKSSPKLAESVLKGKVFPKVEVHFTASYTDGGRVTYLAYELKNVQISSFQQSVAQEGRPQEALSLNYEEIKCTYIENDEAGKKKGQVEYQWKVSQGKA